MNAQPPPHSPQSSGSAEALAAEFLEHREAGLEVEVEAWAGRLTDEAAREEFRQFVEDADAASSFLPRQVAPGVLLGGRYRIVREIGSGGMGKVFEAQDQHLRRRVAVKVLAAFGSPTFDPGQLFMKESRLLAALQHPNIVAVHEAGRDGDVHFIVMDLVEGRSLVDVLAALRAATGPGGAAGTGGRAPASGRALAAVLDLPPTAGRAGPIDPRSWWRTAAGVMREIVVTLEAAHARGVIHRDLKPGNIMLRGDGSPVLLDFGLSSSADAQDGIVTRGLFGSIAYVAPEQARSSEVGTDPRTDVYQLGLVLYELLTLQRAFPDDGLAALLEKIALGNFARPRALDAGVPPELEAICLRATELQPERRYQTMREFREDLDRFLGGRELPLAARGGPLAGGRRRARYFLRRHRTALALGAMLVVAVGIATWRAAVAPPARLAAYRYDSREGPAVPGVTGDPTFPDELLGVRVHTDAPCYVYALSVFGERGPRSFVKPMVPEALLPEGAEGAEAAERVGWALRVTGDGTDVACSKISRASSGVPFEGLWVYADGEEREDLQDWLQALADESRLHYGGQGVPYDVARQLWETGATESLTRGGDPVQTEDARRALLAKLEAQRRAEEEAEAGIWPFEDPRRFEVYFRVQP